jgi:hypothetical protein
VLRSSRWREMVPELYSCDGTTDGVASSLPKILDASTRVLDPFVESTSDVEAERLATPPHAHASYDMVGITIPAVCRSSSRASDDILRYFDMFVYICIQMIDGLADLVLWLGCRILPYCFDQFKVMPSVRGRKTRYPGPDYCATAMS